MRNKATLEQLRQTYPTSLCGVLTWFWCFGVGQNAQFNPTAAMVHPGVHFCLLGVSSLRVSVSPVSFSGCSYVPARSACLLRLTAAGASRCSCTTRPPVETERPWCALMRSPSLQPSSAHPPLTTKTCPRVIEYAGSRAYKYRYVYIYACVHAYETVHKRKWVRLGLREWVIQQHNGSQLLPAPAQLTAAAAMRW